MRTAFRKSFSRDVKKIKDQTVLDRIQEAIYAVEDAIDLSAIAGLKKLGGGENSFRIRIGEYRLGIVLDGDVVVFVRCLNRRDLYRYFP
ncbi:MAG: hypothetical protein KF861_06800 [Planctomycetaceae bacterium]|nr:hypothetical protein [Planctomycetaceae bacterium]